MKNLEDITKIVCIGVGGGDVFYVAKFFHLLGAKVEGYDYKKSERTQELETAGIAVNYKNPDGPIAGHEIAIYSDALPDALITRIKGQNPQIEFVEVGDFKNNLIEDYENDKLSEDAQTAFLNSDIAPLYNTQLGNTKLIGVTGTDGKTTVSSMIYHILSDLGYKVGIISTVGAKIGDKELDTGLHVTTPSSQDLLKLIMQMQQANCTHIIVECTSQGLYMGRLAGLKFDVAVYTNIKSDHMSYHKTWENYAHAKSLLATRHLKVFGTTVLNADDTLGYEYLRLSINENFITYSLSSVQIVARSLAKTDFKYNGDDFTIPFMGEYNISNALAATSALQALGEDINKALMQLEDMPPIPGRMNIIQQDPFTVIVDFAHTANGLKNLLESVHDIKSPNQRIILVFGCAAKRDEYKRPTMGKYAKEYADITILTAEDCRTEGLEKINNEIETGWQKLIVNEPRQLLRFDEEMDNVKVRRDAIKKAVELAKPDDIILITGKGHEQSLCFGDTEYPWNDSDAVKEILKKLPG